MAIEIVKSGFNSHSLRDTELFNKLAENFMGENTMDEVVKIKKSDLLFYIEDSLLLGYLGCAGVDNWLGYEEAYRNLSDNRSKIDEILNEVVVI
jgi:hypothetical protein